MGNPQAYGLAYFLSYPQNLSAAGEREPPYNRLLFGKPPPKKIWQTPKLFQSSAQFLLTLPPPPLSHQFKSYPPPHPLSLKRHCQFSCRDLAIFTSSLLLLGPHQTLDPFHLSKAQAEESPPNTNKNGLGENSNTISSPSCIDTTLTKKAFLDISINGEPIGQIVISLFGNTAPTGLPVGLDRKGWMLIWQRKIGSSLAVEKLQDEWERVSEICLEGSVSIIVRDP